MPHHKSPERHLRSDARRRERNRQTKSAVRTAAKKVRSAKSPEEALEAHRRFTSVVDKAVRKGVVRKGTASRMKSRLSRRTKPAA